MNIKDKALKLDDNVQVKIELMSPRQKKEEKKRMRLMTSPTLVCLQDYLSLDYVQCECVQYLCVCESADNAPSF